MTKNCKESILLKMNGGQIVHAVTLILITIIFKDILIPKRVTAMFEF